MKITPLYDRVILKWLEKENKTNSWIYIPESKNKEKPFMYEVISIWPWKEWFKDINIKVWDKVLAGQYAWDEVKIDWQEYKIIAFEYILAKVED